MSSENYEAVKEARMKPISSYEARKWDAFISYSSANRELAKRVEADLEGDGLRVWLDDSEIALGVLLANELQLSIENSRVFVLLWSKQAAESRWVVSEILTAFHVGRFIIPCVIDDTRLPYFLNRTVWLNLTTSYDGSVVESLQRAVRNAPDSANKLPVRMSSQSSQVKEVIQSIWQGQKFVTDRLQERKVKEAGEAQKMVHEVLQKTLSTPARLDPMIVNLAGYHYKNAYMIKHWDQVQAGHPPQDPLLEESEGYFFETLLINPRDSSALNGVGSVLIFRRDIDAAEFFILRAIDQSKRDGISYDAAQQDLDMIRYYRKQADFSHEKGQ